MKGLGGFYYGTHVNATSDVQKCSVQRPLCGLEGVTMRERNGEAAVF